MFYDDVDDDDDDDDDNALDTPTNTNDSRACIS